MTLFLHAVDLTLMQKIIRKQVRKVLHLNRGNMIQIIPRSGY
jgi:hypothetical protein